MPAIERRFTGVVLPPAKLYVDTDLLVATAVRTHQHHARASALFSLLAQHGLTTLYLCPVTWMEFVHVFSKEEFRRGLPAEFGHLNASGGWADARVRDTYYQFVIGVFHALLSPFDWEQVMLTDGVQTRAIQRMATYNLRAQDAVHLACADAAGVRDFASFDRQFRRVDGLYLWNDQLFGIR